MSVHPALKHDKVGAVLLQHRGHDPVPDRRELPVAGAGRERHVDFEAGPVPSARLLDVTRAGEDSTPVLVKVDVEEAAVLVEAVHHPISVVDVDVDVRRALDRPPGEGVGEGDPDVVVDAEAACRLRPRVMQATAGLERSGRTLPQYGVERRQGPPDDPGGRHVAPGKGRGVPPVQRLALPRLRGLLHPLDVRRRMEPGERFDGRRRHHRSLRQRNAGGERPLFRQVSAQLPGPLGERVPPTQVVGKEVVVPDQGGAWRRRHGAVGAVAD